MTISPAADGVQAGLHAKRTDRNLRTRALPRRRRLGLEMLEDRRLLSIVPFPVPLEAIDPLGSLIYESSVSAQIAVSGETDQFTIDLDANPGQWGQTITVVVDPNATLQPTIELLDPGDFSLGSVTAGAAGKDGVLQTVATTGAGTYAAIVGGAAGSTGSYAIRLLLSAAVEDESHDGPANDDPASAQGLDGSFITLDAASVRPHLSERGAVLGTADSSGDWYRFTLEDAESVTLTCFHPADDNFALELYDGSGNLVTAGIAVADVASVIETFIDATGNATLDDYYVRIAGGPQADYNLVVTRNADFDWASSFGQYAGKLLWGAGSVLAYLRSPAAPALKAAGSTGEFDAGQGAFPADAEGSGNGVVDSVAGPADSGSMEYVPGRLIVRFADPKAHAVNSGVVKAVGGRVVRDLPLIDGAVIELADVKADVRQAAARWSACPAVLYAEPDYLDRIAATLPDDRFFDIQWGFHNTGQNGGTPGADVDAPRAWDIFTGSSDVVVAVLDSGVDYDHEDLAANMWGNPGEVAGDGIDNDGNGYIDDVYGIDPANGDTDPRDDHKHGTHVAGTIGAIGNNALGVAGVNWDVQIMALKCFTGGGSGSISDQIVCLDYMTTMKTSYGVNVVASNNSYGGTTFSQAREDAIRASIQAGIPFVAGAGNNSTDNDVEPHYPSGYELDGIISVAATDRDDGLAEVSDYGATSVDLGAPGVGVMSTMPGMYGTMTGSSMSTSFVTGAVALLRAYRPDAPIADVFSAILRGVDRVPGLDGVTVTGGRLNLANSLERIDQRSNFYMLEANAGDTLVVTTTTPGDGPLQFENLVDPAVRLYGPQGTLLAGDDDGAADGRNALLTHEATTTGTYSVQLSATYPHSGECLLSVTGQTAALPAFQIAATDPADGRAVPAGEPLRVTVDFNHTMRLDSLDASDLTVDGAPAAAVTIVDRDTAVFECPAGISPGAHHLAVAAGAILDLQATPVEPFVLSLWGFAVGPLIVSTTDDRIDGDYGPGNLSLREALALALMRVGDDVIHFDDALSGGTITLDRLLGQLDIDSHVTIEGPGADELTIDAAGGSRVFEVAEEVTASIGGLTITGGDAVEEGGGLYNRGTLTLADCTISHNSVFAEGPRSPAQSRGGGVYSLGSLTIANTTISGNSAVASRPSGTGMGFGGGVCSEGDLTINNSTISGNSVSADAPSGHADAHGGGVYSEGNLTITNTTICGNSASAEAPSGTPIARGGGIYVSAAGPATLHNVILADNDAEDDGRDAYGSFDAAGSHNLIGVIDGSTGLDGTGTLYGTAGSALDPRLGPLQDNGGPTLTRPLLWDSPAIDAGSNDRATEAGLVFDQRGFYRIADGNGDHTIVVDMGAVEFGSSLPPEVVACHVFYNNSAFDGDDPAANSHDDHAVAPDKTALLPGHTATFANYTSYSRGINGIMVDVAGLPGVPTADDFEFRLGNGDDPTSWTPGPEPSEVTLRPGDGVERSDRITLIWPDNTIQKQWLRVTVAANVNTGLAEPDVFYFGNAIGETGNSATDAKVNAIDVLGARDNQRDFSDPAPIDFNFDFNRDARVNATDMLIARNNTTHFLNALKLITVTPEVTGPAAKAADGTPGPRDVALGLLGWLYEFEPTGTATEPSNKPSEAERVPCLHTSEP